VFLNERVVNIIQTAHFGNISFISIGATCVGSIVDNFGLGRWEPSFFLLFLLWTLLTLPHLLTLSLKTSVLNKGDQIGQFEYGGSTVVLLFQPGMIVVDDDILQYSSLNVETYVHVNTQIGRAVVA